MDIHQNNLPYPVEKTLPDGSRVLLSSRGFLVSIPRGLDIEMLCKEPDVILDQGNTLKPRGTGPIVKKKEKSKEKSKEVKVVKEVKENVEKEPLDVLIYKISSLHDNYKNSPREEVKQQVNKALGKFVRGMNEWVKETLLQRLEEDLDG